MLPKRFFHIWKCPPAKDIFLSLWQRFDVNWYLRIATRGYDPKYPPLVSPGVAEPTLSVPTLAASQPIPIAALRAGGSDQIPGRRQG